jgi:hypothetical protein
VERVNLRGTRVLNRRLLVSTLAWVGGACAAVLVAMLALSLIGDGLGAGQAQPLSAEAAGPERPLPTPGVPSLDGGPSPSRTPAATSASLSSHPPQAVTRLLTSSGGTAVARCVEDRVYLVSWSPAQGYRADEVLRGPARVARVSFESSRREVTIEARCGSDGPVAKVYVGWNDLHPTASPTPEREDPSPTAYPTHGDR